VYRPQGLCQEGKGYGSAKLWLDQQYGIILRYETHGMSKLPGDPRGYRYLVTSITFGQGLLTPIWPTRRPSPLQLSHRTRRAREVGVAPARHPIPGAARLHRHTGSRCSRSAMQLRESAYSLEWLSGERAWRKGSSRAARVRGSYT
jgi:hypothetical protein